MDLWTQGNGHGSTGLLNTEETYQLTTLNQWPRSILHWGPPNPPSGYIPNSQMYNGNGNTKQWADPSHLFLTTWYKGYFSRKGQVESLKTVPPLEKKKKEMILYSIGKW